MTVDLKEDFPGGTAVKNSPKNQESQEMLVRSLGQEDPLEKAMAIYSSILGTTWFFSSCGGIFELP